MDASHAFRAADDGGAHVHDSMQPTGNGSARRDRLPISKEATMGIHSKIDTAAASSIAQTLSAGLDQITEQTREDDPVDAAIARWNLAHQKFERADKAVALSSPNDGELFDTLVGERGTVLVELLVTPAPTIKELALKLSIYAIEDLQDFIRAAEIGRALDADAQRFAGANRLVSDAEWRSAEQEFACAQQARAARKLSNSDDGDELTKREKVTGEKLLTLPVRSIDDVALKLRTALAVRSTEHGDTLRTILSDIEGLAAPIAEDPAVVQAFEQYRTAAAELHAQPHEVSDAALEKHFYNRMDPADMVLKTTPARTPAGVVMKLKRAFAGVILDGWSDHAVFNPRPADFEGNVRRSDLYQEMLWRAIEDLERMTGGEQQPDKSAFNDRLSVYREAYKKWHPLAGTEVDAEQPAFDLKEGSFLTLLNTPALNVAELAVKMDSYFQEYEGSEIDEDRFQLIRDDLARLAAAA